MICCFFFLLKQKTSYEMRISYWSSDVCSSDLRSCGAGFIGQRSAGKATLTRSGSPSSSCEAMHEQSLPGSPSCAHSASAILAKSDWPHPASATPAPPANSSDKRMRCGFIVEYLPKTGPGRLTRGKLIRGHPQSLDKIGRASFRENVSKYM